MRLRRITQHVSNCLYPLSSSFYYPQGEHFRVFVGAHCADHYPMFGDAQSADPLDACQGAGVTMGCSASNYS
jgi:hypothetical protein